MKKRYCLFWISALVFISQPSFAFGFFTKDLPKFGIVEGGKLYRGGRPTPKGLQMLQALNIKTVLDLQGGDYTEHTAGRWIFPHFVPGESWAAINKENAETTNLEMQFESEPLAAVVGFHRYVTEKEDQEINQSLAVMTNPNMQPVYIHCVGGWDRTGLVIALYRVLQGWSIEKAHSEWVASGHKGLNRIFTRGLDEYFYQKASTLNPN